MQISFHVGEEISIYMHMTCIFGFLYESCVNLMVQKKWLGIDHNNFWVTLDWIKKKEIVCFLSSILIIWPYNNYIVYYIQIEVTWSQIRRIWWLFLAKWSRRTSAVWDGALSWCKNHELSAQNIFWNGVERSSWNFNSFRKVSNCQSTIFVH